MGTTYQFTGQRREAVLGLYFYNARWYDSAIGRFLQPDTIVPSPGDPQSLNRYAYTRNNPVKYRDPSGHTSSDPGQSTIGGSLGGGGGDVLAALYFALRQDLGKIGEQIAPTTTQTTEKLVEAAEVVSKSGSQPVAVNAAKVIINSVAQEAVAGTEATNTVAVASSHGLNVFSRAAEFGIRSYNQLRDVISSTGLQAHHLIEKRFAERLGLAAGNLDSIALTPQEHQMFTNAWRQAIGYIGDRNSLDTATASSSDIWTAAQKVYADYPELLQRVQQALFGQ